MKAKLLEDVRRLPIAERIDLVGAIWDTIDENPGPDELPVSATHREELDRRLADLEAHPETSIPWEEVRDRFMR